MKPNMNEMLGPNWILIAGGALLSTLSVRVGYRLKKVLESKQQKNSTNGLKENGKRAARKRIGNCRSHSNLYCFEHDDGCFDCISGIEGDTKTKSQPELALPLTTISSAIYTKESTIIWSSAPDILDSPSISDASSDIFTKREVIQKLKHQLKKRDDMVLEMQDQIAELQRSLTSQRTSSDCVQSLLEAANRDVFDSQREIQRLRKVIADVLVGDANGFKDLECLDKVEMLRKEIGELKELIQGKDYLLQSYKEQKCELSLKVKELQHRVDSQVTNIF